jgi:small GTP-binding protein
MAFVNFNSKEITAKIVYYGPGLGGKTSSLQYIYNNLPEENRGKMISLATDEDRTIYFDFLPLHLGKIQNFTVKVQLYTVPGQVRYNATRKLVLKGVDGIVFVADSQIHRKFSNIESYNNLEENLLAYHKDLKDIPHVIQYNKIDLPNIIKTEELNQILNKYGAPYFQTCAITGIGIMDSLKSISKLVFAELSRKGITSKSYLIEKPPVEEHKDLEEKVEEKETPFVAETEISEPSERKIEEAEIEELSTSDVEIVEDDLSLIEPHYNKIEEESIFSSIDEQQTIEEKKEEIVEKIEEEKAADQYLKQLDGIEYTPEHFAADISLEEEEVDKSKSEIAQESSFEELDDLSAFVQIEEGESSEKEEEITFAEFVRQEVSEESSPFIEGSKSQETNIESGEIFIEEENKIEDIKELEGKSYEEQKIAPELAESPLLLEEKSYEDKSSEFEKILEDKIAESFEPEVELPKEDEKLKKISPEEPAIEPVEELFIDSQVNADIKEKVVSEVVPDQQILETEISEIMEVATVDEIGKEKEEIIEKKEEAKTLYEGIKAFSYSTLTEDITLKEQIIAMENALIDNQQNDVYQLANQIFERLLNELNFKFEVENLNTLEKLLLIGIQPADYKLFLKNIRFLKKGDILSISDLYYIHNFLFSLLFKINQI